MLTIKANFLKADLLPGKDDFPPSCLAALLDADSGDVLNLIGPAELHDQLRALKQFDEVTVRLRWRRMDLRSLGGSGRGKAYRLQMVEVLATETAQ